MFLKFYYLSSTLFMLYFSVSYFYRSFNMTQNEKLSHVLMSSYDIATLYSDTSTHFDSPSINLDNGDSFSVIGILQIDKIDIKYPILSEISNYLLQVSPCRFHGPLPNEPGNLCIAGHNYNDDRFFSRLYQLSLGDIVVIHDNLGNYIPYVIYHKYETTKDDTSSLRQTTDGSKELTLVTCNNANGNRLIIKAKNKGT